MSKKDYKLILPNYYYASGISDIHHTLFPLNLRMLIVGSSSAGNYFIDDIITRTIFT